MDSLITVAARLIAHGEDRLLLLEEVEALLASRALVVDACFPITRIAELTPAAWATRNLPKSRDLVSRVVGKTDTLEQPSDIHLGESGASPLQGGSVRLFNGQPGGARGDCRAA